MSMSLIIPTEGDPSVCAQPFGTTCPSRTPVWRLHALFPVPGRGLGKGPGLGSEVLDWPYAVGGGGGTPPLLPPPLQTKVTIVIKNEIYHREKSCRPIFGTHTFGSQTPLPPF